MKMGKNRKIRRKSLQNKRRRNRRGKYKKIKKVKKIKKINSHFFQPVQQRRRVLRYSFPIKQTLKIMAKKLRKIPTENTYFAIMRPHRGLGGETFTTNCTVERAIFQPLQLGLVVPQMLLQVGQLNEGSTAIRHVAFVRTFTYKEQFNNFLDKKKLLFLQSDVWVWKKSQQKLQSLDYYDCCRSN